MNIKSLLDYGYKHITEQDMQSIIEGKTIVRHLPNNLKYHSSYLFHYLQLATESLQAHYETIIYRK